MDAHIQQLAREAAEGDTVATARLAHALGRLGREALTYTGPDTVPVRVTAPPRRDSAPNRHGKLGNRRHQVICAASVDALDRAVETSFRRVGRAACDEGLAEWRDMRESGEIAGREV